MSSPGTGSLRRLAVLLVVNAWASVATGAPQSPGRDVFSFVRALDEAGARQVWPGFNPAEWPIALFDGQQTVLLRHPGPPPEFAPLPGRPGVLAMPGRHPAVVANSTREIGGVRTATVIVTPAQEPEGSLLACLEEVFHVFWLRRHTNFRPNEMARYAYPVEDRRNLRRLLAEDEALARALEAEDPKEAAGWAASALRIRHERLPGLSDDDRAFETGLEMMEGTANYVARVAVGQDGEATAARLRSDRASDQIRWRFYDSGSAICFLLDRFLPDWKILLDRDLERTTTALLGAALARRDVPPAAFSAAEWTRFEERADGGIAALSARRRAVREELLGRSGTRLIVEIAGDAEPLRVTHFDPIHVFVLDGGEAVHASYVTLTCRGGTIELNNPDFARGSFAGTVAVTRAAGRHPLADGIRTLTVVGMKAPARVTRTDDRLALEAEGVRLTLPGAGIQTEGRTLRVRLPARGD